MIKRHNIELVTLSSIYNFPEDAGYYFDNVSPDWFSTPACRIFFDTCKDLHSRGIPTNSLGDLLQGLKDRDIETLWSDFLARIMDNMTSMDCPSTVSVLKGEYLRKMMSLACSRGLTTLNEVADAYEAVSAITKDLTAIDTDSVESFISASDLAAQSYERIKSRVNKESEQGYKTGFDSFDALLNIRNALLILIAGRPGMGKTAFALSIVRRMCLDDISVGFFSLEMPKEEIDDRFTQMDTAISTNDMNRYRGVTDRQLKEINGSCNDRRAWKLQIDDGSSTIDAIERKARRMRRMGIQILFIDQASRISGGRGSDYEKFTERSNRIAALKKELKIPIVLLAQINRGSDMTASKEPSVSHLKQTGSFEEDADIIFLLHRPEEFETDPVKKAPLIGRAIVNMAKHRQGQTLRENMHFIAERCMYSDHGYISKEEAERYHG